MRADDPMRDGPEIELKFLFAERDVANVKALVAAASSARQATHQRLRTVYFDTPNQDLWNHGFTLRVRRSGNAMFRPSSGLRPHASKETNGKRKPAGPCSIWGLSKILPSRVSPANLPFAAQ